MLKTHYSDPPDRKKTCIAMGERREASIQTYALGTELLRTYSADKVTMYTSIYTKVIKYHIYSVLVSK